MVTPAVNLYHIVKGAYGGASKVISAITAMLKEEEKEKEELERIKKLRLQQEQEGIEPDVLPT